MRFAAFFLSLIFLLATYAGAQDTSLVVLAGGHLYGSHEQENRNEPAATLLNAADRIHASGAEYFVALGDVVRDSRREDCFIHLEQFKAACGMKFFLLPGNHDLIGDQAWAHGFTSLFAFRYGNTLALGWNSMPADLMEEKSLETEFGRRFDAMNDDGQIENIVFFSHCPDWNALIPALAETNEWYNAPLPVEEVNLRLQRFVTEFIRKHLGKLHFYLIAGDAGAPWAMNRFRQDFPIEKVTVIASGIYDSKEDALLRIEIPPHGEPRLSLLMLDGSPAPELAVFDMAYWRKYFAEHPRESDGIVSRIFRKISNPFLLSGLALLLMAGLLSLVRKKKKK